MFSVLVLVPKCMCTEEDKLGLVLSFCHVMLRSLDLVVSISIQWLPDISFNLMLIIFLLLCVCVWTCVCEFHLEKMEVVVVGNIFHFLSTLRIEAESVNQTQSSPLCLIGILSLLLRLELQNSSLANQHLCGFWGLGSSCSLDK